MRKELNAIKTKPEETEIAEENWERKNEKQAEDRNLQPLPI